MLTHFVLVVLSQRSPCLLGNLNTTVKSEYFEKKQLCWIIPTVVLNRHLTLDYLNLSCNTFYRALECLNDVLDYSSLPGTMFHWVLEYPNDGLDSSNTHLEPHFTGHWNIPMTDERETALTGDNFTCLTAMLAWCSSQSSCVVINYTATGVH